MDNKFLIAIILLMFLISYLMKMVPMVFCKGKIKNKFLNSFLYYIPFAVITSMTIPEVFHSTSSIISASCGVALAVVLVLVGQSLLVIALSSTVIVFIVENFVLRLF